MHPALCRLFPQGLTRGSSIVCLGAAAVSTAFVLTSAATQAGAWVGVAGLPAFGTQACLEMGTVLERVVVVREPDAIAPGRRGDDSWAPVLGALVDGFELVVFGAARHVRPATARRVQARLQTRGSVLVLVGEPGPFAVDARVVTEATWDGLGAGNGYLRQRTVEVIVEGRRVPRPRHDRLAMPGPTGRIESLHDHPAPVAPGLPELDLRRTG